MKPLSVEGSHPSSWASQVVGVPLPLLPSFQREGWQLSGLDVAAAAATLHRTQGTFAQGLAWAPLCPICVFSSLHKHMPCGGEFLHNVPDVKRRSKRLLFSDDAVLPIYQRKS